MLPETWTDIGLWEYGSLVSAAVFGLVSYSLGLSYRVSLAAGIAVMVAMGTTIALEFTRLATLFGIVAYFFLLVGSILSLVPRGARKSVGVGDTNEGD